MNTSLDFCTQRAPERSHETVSDRLESARSLVSILFIAAAFTLCLPSAAHAYIGAALSAGGAVMAGLLILSVLLAVYVLVWFPIKRRLRERKQAEVSGSSEEISQAQAQSSDDVG